MEDEGFLLTYDSIDMTFQTDLFISVVLCNMKMNACEQKMINNAYIPFLTSIVLPNSYIYLESIKKSNKHECSLKSNCLAGSHLTQPTVSTAMETLTVLIAIHSV